MVAGIQWPVNLHLSFPFSIRVKLGFFFTRSCNDKVLVFFAGQDLGFGLTIFYFCINFCFYIGFQVFSICLLFIIFYFPISTIDCLYLILILKSIYSIYIQYNNQASSTYKLRQYLRYHNRLQLKVNIINSEEMENPPKNTQPRKISYKLHYFNKDDYSIFLYYSQGHPVNLKQKFSLGYMKIFSSDKLYNRELFSTDHLNQDIQWSNRFFQSLLHSFKNFQIKPREDEIDKQLDFYVRGNVDEGDNMILLHTVLAEDFGSDIQKQFWKHFQSYNDSKNQQIAQCEQQSRVNQTNQEKKLESIKKYCQNCEIEKKQLLGRLSAILSEKVNKLREYEQDYNIELFEQKFKKSKQEQEQRVMSTYQEEAVFGASLFQPSQEFR